MRLFSRKTQLVYSAKRVLINREREEIVAPSPDDVQCYQRQLEMVATLFSSASLDWQIEGGLAVALLAGGFLRQHGDIDVAIFWHQLSEFEACLRRHGYRLFSRNGFHLWEYAPFDVLRATSADEIRNRRRVKRIMAVKVDEGGLIDRRLAVLSGFDVHVHRLEEDTVYLDCGQTPFPRRLFEKTSRVALGGGRSVIAASAPLMYYYKLAGRRPRHKFDLALLEQNDSLSANDQAWAREVFLAQNASLPEHARVDCNSGDQDWLGSQKSAEVGQLTPLEASRLRKAA